ncbi:MAG TPA: UDP-glucuronic acid decarboxylase family protein [Actinomycetota bacterium]|nr:UDP-glucuronic acid decarboxylase family protein [Actinomycetota bacterium]
MTRALVTGGAGFLGSHLCRRLLESGWDIVCLDSLITGRDENIADLMENRRFTFQRHDVTRPFREESDLDWVLHLASPASPKDYLTHPIETLEVGALGTRQALSLAREKGAALFLASTSEVYGDPLVHPQPETYWGNVNPVGPRSVYDEAKRFAEALVTAYHRTHGIPVRIARIFNTYGPGMRRGDGRAVPTFIEQALRDAPLTVHGEGRQTRALCFVDDLIEGVWRLLRSDVQTPVNLGNPEEVPVRELAAAVRDAAGSGSSLVFEDRPEDDPERRRPDITMARKHLDWEPQVKLSDGLKATIAWARKSWL